MFNLILVVLSGDLGHEWIFRVRIREQRTYRQEHLRNSQGGTPLVLEDVEANTTVLVNVTVINLCFKLDLRGLKWVVRGEVDAEEKDAAVVGRILRPHDRSRPVEHVRGILGTG